MTFRRNESVSLAGDAPSTPPSATVRRARREKPSAYVWFILFYCAMFLLRPWEYDERFAILPWEKLFAFLLIAAVGALLATQRSAQKPGPVMMAWLIFIVMLLMTWAMSINPRYGWLTVEKMLKLTIFGTCLSIALKTRSDLRFFTLGWIAIQIVYQTKSVWEHFVHGKGIYRMGIWRLMGIDETWSHPNSFAATTVFLLPLVMLALRTESSRIIRAILVAEIGMAILVVVKTGSRGGLLMLGIYLLLTVLLSRRRFLAIGLVAVATVVTIFVMPDDLVSRYKTIIDTDQNASAQESAEGRVEGFYCGVAIAARLPLNGVGPGCFTLAHTVIMGLPGKPGLQAHNLAGQLLGEVGYFGTAVWLMFYVVLVWSFGVVRHRARRQRDPYLAGIGRAGLEIAFLLLLFGIVGHNAYRYTWLWIGVLADISLRILDSRRRTS